MPTQQCNGSIAWDLFRELLPTLSHIGEVDLPTRLSNEAPLENTDDVVYVVSSKCIFCYISPAIQKALWYGPQELVGAALPSICRPWDCDSVMHDLRVQSGSPIYLFHRIRSKHSGYLWFESRGYRERHGITLIGRGLPIYTLCRRQLRLSNGLQDTEVRPPGYRS